VAPGVFVHQGRHEDFAHGNRGGIANLGFIVGEQAVAVIDTGGSQGLGSDLLEAIRARTPLPIAWVVNTHAHPDHSLGNGAFADAGAVLVGHERLPRAIAERGPFYLANMERLLGPAAAGSRLVPPGMTVAVGGPVELDLGDRRLELRAWPTAHTDADLTVLDLASGTLFAGDLVFMERLPVVDGSLKGWLAALDGLEAVAATRVVPGHGPPGAAWPAALAPQRAYLEELLASVRAALAANRRLEDAVASIPPPATPWLLRDGNHERNVTASYTELEWE
jgi:quinoprotein relay system zinc metallohydrolase 2